MSPKFSCLTDSRNRTNVFVVLLISFCLCHVTVCMIDHDEALKPSQLAVNKSSYTFIQISWSPPTQNLSQLQNYQVTDRLDRERAEERTRHVPANETTCYIRGLKPGTRYSFYVASNFSTGFHPHSSTQSEITLGYGPDRACNCSVWGSYQTSTCSNHTGQCVCKSKLMTGRRCDRCYDGYYIHEHLGCQACDCKRHLSNGTCRLDDGVVMCNCRDGHSGVNCNLCQNGLYLVNGKCTQCQCNGNANLSSPNICDIHTGECTACIYNTTGSRCEGCLPGYEGDALVHNCTRNGTPVMSHSAVVIIIISVCFVLVIGLIVVMSSLFRWRHKNGSPFKFWSIRLRDDHENVNFSALTDQSDPRVVDAALVNHDAVEFASKKQSLEFQPYSPHA